MATVFACENFNAEADAKALRSAMTGIKTNDQVIINIATKRNNAQRQQIRESYKSLYKKDLLSDLSSTLKFNFKDVVVALFTKPRIYDVDCLTDAIYGPGTNETTLIEILVSRKNEEIQEIRTIYEKLHETTLSKDIEGDTSGNFMFFLLSLQTGDRGTNQNIDSTKAKEDAKRLYEEMEKSKRANKDPLLSMVGSLSFPQLRATFNVYERLAEKDITKTISNKFSGDIKRGLVAIVDAARSLPIYFAKGLYKSMKGLGTDDKRLIRIIVSRSEVDLGKIKSAFQTEYKKSLASFIYDDTSGSYRKILLALVEE